MSEHNFASFYPLISKLVEERKYCPLHTKCYCGYSSPWIYCMNAYYICDLQIKGLTKRIEASNKEIESEHSKIALDFLQYQLAILGGRMRDYDKNRLAILDIARSLLENNYPITSTDLDVAFLADCCLAIDLIKKQYPNLKVTKFTMESSSEFLGRLVKCKTKKQIIKSIILYKYYYKLKEYLSTHYHPNDNAPFSMAVHQNLPDHILMCFIECGFTIDFMASHTHQSNKLYYNCNIILKSRKYKLINKLLTYNMLGNKFYINCIKTTFEHVSTRPTECFIPKDYLHFETFEDRLQFAIYLEYALTNFQLTTIVDEDNVKTHIETIEWFHNYQVAVFDKIVQKPRFIGPNLPVLNKDVVKLIGSFL